MIIDQEGWRAMALVIRKIELFSMHAHQMPHESYDRLFNFLHRLPTEARIYRSGGLFIGFPLFQRFSGGYFIQAIEGVDGETPLIFDFASGQTRNEQLAGNEIYAHATHLFVKADERRAMVEYVRRGAKGARIATAIERIARSQLDGYEDLRFELSPVVGRGFSTQISMFERIREASIRVIEPNASWSDHYTALSEIIDESDGSNATLDVRAGRGQSLSKSKGIVGIMKEVVNDKQPYLQEASITGTRRGESAETTVRATKFVAQSQVRVQADESKNVAPTDIRAKLAEIASAIISNFR